ncbi:MAG: cyclic nucleotide-binding domain-containing protein [Proteobacteria bacterium]|nr:cyclic nucleotide-binding domain-containing protein [Pseudomonadota bacterium]
MTEIKKQQTGKMKQTIIDFLITMSLFDELSPIELGITSDYMNFFEFEQGKVLFKEGDPGDYICFVVEGAVDILKQSATGQRAVIATLTRGSTIGEMSIIDNIARSATVRARKHSTLVLLSRKGFNTILDQHPKIGIKILKGIARLLSLNMRRTSSHLADHLIPG